MPETDKLPKARRIIRRKFGDASDNFGYLALVADATSPAQYEIVNKSGHFARCSRRSCLTGCETVPPRTER